MNRILAMFSLFALSGCATMVEVTYYSDPAGATFYEGGRLWGYTPVTLNYTPTEEFKAGGCMQLKGSMVRWASGAEASLSAVQACAAQGYSQQLVYARPTGIPGRQVDVQFALELQRTQALESQARSQAAMAAMGLLSSSANAAPAPRPQPSYPAYKQPKSVQCTSRVVNATVYTECR